MQSKLFIAVIVMAAATLGLRGPSDGPAITQDEMVRRSQEMFDAVVPGNQEPFKKYYADDALYFDEKGRDMDKAALIKDIQPMPKGYSGSIKIVRPKSHIEGNVAILSYDMDETETVFGQNLTARYHQTDTWMLRAGKWQIVATQVLRYYEDPAPGKGDASKYILYTGIYLLGEERTITVTTKDGHLYAQRHGKPKEELVPEASDIFFRKGVEGRTLFHTDDHGQVDSLIDRRNNEDIVWKKAK